MAVGLIGLTHICSKVLIGESLTLKGVTRLEFHVLKYFYCPDYFVVFEGMFLLYTGLVLGTDWMDKLSRRQYSSNTLSTRPNNLNQIQILNITQKCFNI